jgi:hypothetical protein
MKQIRLSQTDIYFPNHFGVDDAAATPFAASLFS